MKMRMQPVGQPVLPSCRAWCATWPRPAASRSGSRSTAEDTELDKTMLEAIKDPLTHLVRNAVDHGIEPPADRLAAGKPSEGA